MIDKNLTLDTSRTTCLKPEEITEIVTGDVLPPKGVVDIVTGDVLSAKPLPTNDDLPLNYARIGYDNILYLNDSLSSSVVGGAAGGSDTVDNVTFPDTYSKWRMPSTNDGDARFLFGLAGANYAALMGHNAGTTGAVINLYTTNDSGADWDLVGSFTPANNNPIYVRFSQRSINGLRVTIAGSVTDSNEIAVVYVGEELVMMRPTYSGHSPVTLSSTDVFTPQKSDGGQFLGKQIVRKGFATQAAFRHLEYSWYESEFQPFVIHAKSLPYFWCWNLLEHPEETAYGWTNQNIKPSLMGVRNWLEVSFDIEAHGNQ